MRRCWILAATLSVGAKRGGIAKIKAKYFKCKKHHWTLSIFTKDYDFWMLVSALHKKEVRKHKTCPVCPMHHLALSIVVHISTFIYLMLLFPHSIVCEILSQNKKKTTWQPSSLEPIWLGTKLLYTFSVFLT